MREGVREGDCLIVLTISSAICLRDADIDRTSADIEDCSHTHLHSPTPLRETIGRPLKEHFHRSCSKNKQKNIDTRLDDSMLDTLCMTIIIKFWCAQSTLAHNIVSSLD